MLTRRLTLTMEVLASTTPRELPARRAAQRKLGRRKLEQREKVTLLEGCVMSGLFAHVNSATERALDVNGHRVCTTSAQRCCGALHAHAGDLEGARALAKQNIAAFERSDAELVVVNAAGFGA